jgi:hypothetical protein
MGRGDIARAVLLRGTEGFHAKIRKSGRGVPQLGQGKKTDGWRQANQYRHKMLEGNWKPSRAHTSKT